MDFNNSTNVFKSGDRVILSKDIDSLKLLQEGHGGWNPFMEKFIDKVGVVQGINQSDDVIVKYEEFGDTLWRFNPQAFRKFQIDKIKCGDAVKILNDIEKVKRCQSSHTGWNSGMESALGKIGTVKIVFPGGDLLVSVSGKVFAFNPQCCTKVPRSLRVEEDDIPLKHAMKEIKQMFDGNPVFKQFLESMEINEDSDSEDRTFRVGDTVKIIQDIEKVKKSQDGFGGWVDSMELILGKTGKVKRVLPNGGLRVSVCGIMCFINPKCCRKVSHSTDDDDNDLGSMSDRMQQLFSTNCRTLVLDGFVGDAGIGNTRNVKEFIRNHRDEIDKKCSGVTALQVASHKGHKDVVLTLLKAGADLELKDDKGNTALHFSAIGEEAEIMELLLSKGANVNAVNNNQHTALLIAASKESIKCIKILVKHSAAINKKDSFGDTVLHDAILNGNEEIIDILTSKSTIDFTIRNKRGFNVLHHAAINGNNFATECIVKKRRDIVNDKKEDGFAALHLAAINGHRDVSNTLIVKGRAEINIKNGTGQTPLAVAVTQGHLGLIELLISKGANVNEEDEYGNICLHLAVSKQNVSVSKEDLKLIENIRSQLQLDEGERAAVVIACYLVYHGGNLYHKNTQGLRPLDTIMDHSLREKLMKMVSLGTTRSSGATIKEPINVTRDCMLCSDKQATVLFQPCCHLAICEDCNTNVPMLKLCLQCNKPINNKTIIRDCQKKRTEKLEEKYMCPICMERPHNMVFECGHTLCKECGQKWKECYRCKPVQERSSLY